jgi:hypothetical protein
MADSGNQYQQEVSVMQTTQANLIVDVQKVLGRESGNALVSELGGMSGVHRATVSPRASRLVLVDYDPDLTDSQRILITVQRQGFDARLIGM